MIAVIADDFTGAAEITGIAWRYGLQAVLQTDVDFSVDYDVVVIDADTRSKKEKEARQIHKSITGILNQFNIDWIYKKTDSVLRGHIVPELESLLSILHLKKILVIANNPSDGRVIKNNHYYIGDQELHETDFGFDPEFPVKSSVATDIPGSSKILPLTYLDKKSIISEPGIYIPEITTSEDVIRRASEMDQETLPVGGSEFFTALLKAKGLKEVNKQENDNVKAKRKRFFVFASTSEQSRKSVLNLQKSGIPVCNLPYEPADVSKLTEKCLQSWVKDIKTSFNKCPTVVSAVMQPVNRESGFPQALNKFISQMIMHVLESEKPKELIVEGGATASHLVRCLGWKNFTPTREYKTGVVKLKIDQKPGCMLIVKPGSYSWPDDILTN